MPQLLVKKSALESRLSWTNTVQSFELSVSMVRIWLGEFPYISTCTNVHSLSRGFYN